MTAIENPVTRSRPRLLLAHPRAEYARAICRHYGSLGWETRDVASAVEVRSLARRMAPAVVVLSIDLPDESGWLTCDKILQECPEHKVILVTNRAMPTNRCFAAFVKAAAIVHEEAGVEALADEVGGRFAFAVAK